MNEKSTKDPALDFRDGVLVSMLVAVFLSSRSPLATHLAIHLQYTGSIGRTWIDGATHQFSNGRSATHANEPENL